MEAEAEAAPSRLVGRASFGEAPFRNEACTANLL